MPIRAHLPGYRWFGVLGDSAVRTGIYTGVCLAAVFTLWLNLANRMSFLERCALERNIAAAVLLGLFASVPVLRFYRLPGALLISSLLAWTILTIVYRVWCIFFHLLGDKYSAFQVFMLGAVVYLIVATLSWIGTIIWRARQTDISHPNHRAS
jgi:hypothetical protein